MRQRPDMDFHTDEDDADLATRMDWIETACFAAMVILGAVAVTIGMPIVIEIFRRFAQ